jgi:UDPglucose 6-dehydrogenase
VRSSPAFPVLRLLSEAGAEVTAHDPLVGPKALDGWGNVTYVADLADAVKQADAVVIVTRWDHYLRLPELISRLDPPPLVVDGRRMLDRSSVPSYTGIGL